MLALDPRWLAAAGTSRDRLAGAIGLAGPYDFLPMLGAEREVFAPDPGPATQPITYVDGRNPPLTLFAGDADDIVQPRNTLSLAAKIRDAGGPVEAKIYPGLGHIGIITAMAPIFAGRAPVLDDVTAAMLRRPRGAMGQGPSHKPVAWASGPSRLTSRRKPNPAAPSRSRGRRRE